MVTIVITLSVLFLITVTLVVSGRFGDVFYYAFKNIKATLFVALCLCAGAFVGLSYSDMTYAPHIPVASAAMTLVNDIRQPPEDKVLATIRTCQAFVTAQLDIQAGPRTLPERPDSSPSLLHLASAVPPPSEKDWDRCARTFGTNYWKHDIAVNGQNGGQALCRAYRAQTDHRSGEVEAWCDTVFAEPPVTSQ